MPAKLELKEHGGNVCNQFVGYQFKSDQRFNGLKVKFHLILKGGIDMKYAIDSWARQVKNSQEIPESFGAFFDSLKVDSFPYTIFAPPEKWYHQKTTPKLLVILADRMYIAEKYKKQITTTCFLFQDINYIEVGTFLLHSWIAINGNVEGKPVIITVEYNTVVEILFKPIIEKIRSAIHQFDQSDFAETQLVKEKSKFDVLVKSNFKYMNFGKRSLLPGEQIQQFILQPDIRVKFLKYFQRTLSFTHLTILTDHELIIVRDEDSFVMPQRVRYGGIWRYIPLHKVLKMAVESDVNDVVKLTILLSDGVSLSSIFTVSQKVDLALLSEGIDKFKMITERQCV